MRTNGRVAGISRRTAGLSLGLLVLLLGPTAGRAQAPAEAFAQGRSLFDSGDYAGAEKLLRETLAQGPETAELRHLLGLCAAFQGRLDEAEQELLAAIRIDPSFADSRIEIGGLYFKQKRYGESERALRLALVLRPKDVYARDLLATVYFIHGSQERALAEWNKVDKPVLDELVISEAGIPHPRLLERELCFRHGRLIRPGGSGNPGGGWTRSIVSPGSRSPCGQAPDQRMGPTSWSRDAKRAVSAPVLRRPP